MLNSFKPVLSYVTPTRIPIVNSQLLMKGLLSFGWGNGYVGLPQGHPYYGKDYSSIECEVHGGLTFAGPGEALRALPLAIPDYWWIGFDTSHYGDNPTDHSEQFVREETDRLRDQMVSVYNEHLIAL